MSERATLEALLARVLEGTGPDRELDAEIHAATLYIKPIIPEAIVTRECQENGFYAFHHVPGSPGGVSYWHQAPPYTVSLDSALTLVPDGWSWHSALRTYLTPFRATGSVWQDGQQYALFNADANTPARALIAACLKARMEALGD